jgi:hypothetical protein
MQRFSMLKQVVYIEPLDFNELIKNKRIGHSQLVGYMFPDKVCNMTKPSEE